MTNLFQEAYEADLDDQSQGGDKFPEIVKGRVAHIDADFICYAATAYTARDKRYLERIEADPAADKRPLDDESIPRTFYQMMDNAVDALDRLRRKCGAESLVAHVTPEDSLKGFRYKTAVTKEYQGARKDVDKPPHLFNMQLAISSSKCGLGHIVQEADDALAQANFHAHQMGREEFTVIVSRDKDLNMVPGYYYDFEADEVKYLPWDNSYGSIWKVMKTDAKTGKEKFKKLSGRGTAFFWAQCLMGDPVDSIAGLPKTKNPETGKGMSMGPVAAFNLLKDCKSDAEAKAVVIRAWKEWPFEWTHWETGEPVKWFDALIGDMRSLWMRLESHQDVTTWLKTIA